MKSCRTEAGEIPVAGPVETYTNGNVRSCTPSRECVLETTAGKLVPQYRSDDLRRRIVLPVCFYESGKLKSVSLEERTSLFTPAGIILAEMVTFYESGRVKRVFPLNGKLCGYWTQEDEANLAEVLTLETPAGNVSAKIISACFYEDGTVRSITLWPGETLSVRTPAGEMNVRVGISFSPDGKISSVEPADPALVNTPAGMITSFDPDAVGINGDANSLVFDSDGQILQAVTTLTSVVVISDSGKRQIFTPRFRDSLCGNEDKEVVPMIINFSNDTISLRMTPDEEPEVFNRDMYNFETEPFLPQLGAGLMPIGCAI